jgi:hypothetical protein
MSTVAAAQKHETAKRIRVRVQLQQHRNIKTAKKDKGTTAAPKNMKLG